jgi:serine/threonine-protein kinase
VKPAVVLEGRYLLGRELGAGGFSRVYEATDQKTNRSVAVKLVPDAYATQQEVTQRLEREGRIAASLAHPNICAVTDFGRQHGGAPFIVLEKLTGETLAERLAKEPLPHELALDVVTQLLTGLGVAHAAGVFHRDIKPANIFLVDLGAGRVLVKLLDFGLAQGPGTPALDGAVLTSEGFVVGTAAYMSPEQVRGSRDLDARTDVYSAAVVVYEMFSGARPFAHLPEHEVFDAIAHKKAPSLATCAPDAPPSLVRAVDVALNVNREHRPANADAFLERHRPRGLSSTAGEALAMRADDQASPHDDWDQPTWQGPPSR